MCIRDSQKRVAQIGVEVAQAIAHAHKNEILHRDIKPGNLLMDPSGKTWIGDFGVARLRDHVTQATLAGGVVGTMRYLPSEAFSGKWNEQSDVYSLGATLYELLAMQPAFPETDHRQLVRQITQGQPAVPLHQFDASISKDLETVSYTHLTLPTIYSV